MFDLDGTLINAYRAVYLSINHAMKRFGFPQLDHMTVQRAVGFGETTLLRKLVGEKHLSDVLPVYRKHHDVALRKGVKFLPGAKRLLKQLKSDKYTLAIASNRPTRFTKVILKELDMAKDFSYVLCADKARKPKPSGLILRQIINQFSLKPKNAVYVGDMTIDAIAARRARVKSIIVTTGSSLHKEIRKENPHHIIEHVGHVRPILQKYNKEN